MCILSDLDGANDFVRNWGLHYNNATYFCSDLEMWEFGDWKSEILSSGDWNAKILSSGD